MLTDKELKRIEARYLKCIMSRDDEHALLSEVLALRDLVRGLAPSVLPVDPPENERGDSKAPLYTPSPSTLH